MAKNAAKQPHQTTPVSVALVERLADPLKCSSCAGPTRVYATARLAGGKTRRYCKCEWCGRLKKHESVPVISCAVPEPIQTR